MRYVALILLLFTASLTMPMVELEDGNRPVPNTPIDVLSNMSALPGDQSVENVSFVFASFQPPERTPIRTGFKPAVRSLLPDAPVIVPQEVAQVDILDPEVNTSVAIEVEEMTSTILTTFPSNDLRAVSATVLNVRAGPSSRNTVVGAFTFGEQAEITGAARNGWVPVRAMTTDLEGWVFSRYLDPLDGT